MSFATSIHCLDGRIQEPIMVFLRDHYGVEYIDSVTEAGPCRILADQSDPATVEGIIRKVDISLSRHKSNLIALSGHHDCAGNPTGKSEQLEQIRKGIQVLGKYFPTPVMVRLWVNEKWEVEVV